jgi:hypothetical protein
VGTFNSVGVQNYATEQAGVQATAQTLAGYPSILNALRSDSIGSASISADLSKWSAGGYSSVSGGAAPASAGLTASQAWANLTQAAHALNLTVNELVAYMYFVAKGLSPAASAGLVGNFMRESGGEPRVDAVGRAGRGIAQWSEGGRWQPTLMTGNTQADLVNQLNYVWQEPQRLLQVHPVAAAGAGVDGGAGVADRGPELRGVRGLRRPLQLDHASPLLQRHQGVQRHRR